MQPLYLSPRIRRLESQFAQVDPPLMERAGNAAAQLASRLLEQRSGAVLVLAGPGNNGGDGFVVARRLREAGHSVSVVFAGDAARLPADAAAAFAAWQRSGGETSDSLPPGGWALVIDALFGIGLSRPPASPYSDWIEWTADVSCPVLALDVPSGLDGDTGKVIGHAVRATHTISFIALKPGLYTLDGPDHAGEITLAGLDLPAEPEGEDAGMLLSPEVFTPWLRPRPRNSHKGSWGEVGIVGGNAGMAGAVLLAARAALFLGAGKVFAGMLDPQGTCLDPMHPEIMFREAGAITDLASVLLIGPGLGQDARGKPALARALRFPGPLVCDADALNLLAADVESAPALRARTAPSLLTPHPAEAGRLLGCTTAEVQQDRLLAARTLAERYASHVVLKGAGSVLAAPTGRWAINASGNPGLASAGTGDVLGGMIASLLAQGWPPEAALAGAVHLHGAAADALVAQGEGPVGLTAGELAPAARRLLNAWVRERAA